MTESVEVPGEDKLIAALVEMMRQSNEWQIDLLLIGAFAVRAYMKRRPRLTTDLDFVAPRSAQNNLATLFKSLGYEFSAHTRFGGLQAIKDVGTSQIQVDVSIDVIHDMSANVTYPIPLDVFRHKTSAQIMPLKGGFGVEVYVLPLSDQLISKLMTSRDKDAADVLALLLEATLPDVFVNDLRRKAQNAGLAQRINTRLGELMNLSEAAIRTLMSEHLKVQITRQEVHDLHRLLRRLRM